MKSIYCRLFCLFVVLNLAQTYTISSHFGSQISQVTISDQESYLKKKISSEIFFKEYFETH